MNPYTYQKVTSLDAAVMARGAADCFVLAGGTDLIAQMKAGHRRPSTIIDVKTIPEMTAVSAAPDGSLEIGAAVSATSLAGDDRIRARHPALHDAVQLIGSRQIQNRATLGGNVCNAAPSADAVPPLIVDTATARILGPGGMRTMPLEDLFAGPGRTHLAPSEILVSLVLPSPAARSASAYLRFTPRREMDIAIVGAAARLTLGPDHRIVEARIALASVAPTPIRAPSAEAKLAGHPITAGIIADAATAAQSDAAPISDTRASADYRRELIAVLVRRALFRCAARIGVDVPQ
ncbi:MAG: xanthine dehydrogenase family protein subunit M [Alphaproteobacteria bacterium]|nr:xanthine dehydrogenase family protein subunit M [Alphaproteobacteria bacterium]